METTIYKIELSNNGGCIYTMRPKGQILSEAIVIVREALSFAIMKGLSFMEEDLDEEIKCYW